jgi:alpha-N-arabinofuranosidase
LHDNPGGDVQFINNLFVKEGNASQYSKALLPVSFDGNVYTKGAVRVAQNGEQKRFGEMGKGSAEKLKIYNDHVATERNALIKDEFDAIANLTTEKDGIYLSIALDKHWLAEQKRKLVTTELLGSAFVPNLPYENTDGSSLKIDRDYWGKLRNTTNPSPGPFEIKNSGIQKIKVW